MVLSYHSAGETGSTKTRSNRSEIMSTPASTAALAISDTMPDVHAALPFFILLIDSVTVSLSI